MSGGSKSPLDFVSLTPGESAGGNGTYVLNGGPGEASFLYINGMPVTVSELQGDARDINYDTSVELVDQSQMLTTGIPAYYEGQGVVNLVLKSGSNRFHGDAYENDRNTIFDATNYFSTTRAVERQNEYGGAVGGPVIKNRLFFFFNYDNFKYIATVAPASYSLPTTLEQQGNFSQLTVPIYDPATTTCVGSKCTATAFTGNIIPPGRISPIAKTLQAKLPTPFNSNLQNNYQATPETGIKEPKYIGKVDFELNKKNHIYFLTQNGTFNQFLLPNTGPQLPLPYTGARYAINHTKLDQIGDTQTITPNLVNVFGYQMNRYHIDQINPTTNLGDGAAAAGITGIPSSQASLRTSPPSLLQGQIRRHHGRKMPMCGVIQQHRYDEYLSRQRAVATRQARCDHRWPDHISGGKSSLAEPTHKYRL